MLTLRIIIIILASLGWISRNLAGEPSVSDAPDSTPHDRELTPDEKKERLPKFDTHYFEYNSDLFNLQLKRLVNFVDQGSVRWNASLDEVFLTLEEIPASRQARILGMAGLAVGGRSLLAEVRKYLVQKNMNFLWLDLQDIAIFVRHRRVPLQLALSYNVRGETALQFFWQRRRCFLFSQQQTSDYLRLTTYAYFLPRAGLFISNTTYPDRAWKARGFFWHERILRTEFFVQYLNEWPQNKRFYLSILFNLPEIIQDMRLVIFKKPENIKTVF